MAATGEAEDDAGEHWQSSQSTKRNPAAAGTATVPKCWTSAATSSKRDYFDSAAASLVGAAAACEEPAEAAALPAAHPRSAAAAACNVDPVPATCGWGENSGEIGGRANLHECPGRGNGRAK